MNVSPIYEFYIRDQFLFVKAVINVYEIIFIMKTILSWGIWVFLPKSNTRQINHSRMAHNIFFGVEVGGFFDQNPIVDK